MVDVATFAAGCFWGVEAAFRRLDGVVETAVGYTGGSVANPTYEQVCAGDTRHAEAVQVKYDPARVSYDDLLNLFWEAHDPTQLDRQGWDVGSQYRSAIFTHGADQADVAQKSKAALEGSKRFGAPIVTEIAPIADFWMAEDYHQQYFEKQTRGRRLF